MGVSINTTSRAELSRLISSGEHVKLSGRDQEVFDRCLMNTETFYIGRYDGDLACIWGLIPPTLLSDNAYIWLYTTDMALRHQMALIRHSQIAMAKMLETYPRIIGHCVVEAERSIAWLRWLGATFGPPQGKLIPFTITAKEAASG